MKHIKGTNYGNKFLSEKEIESIEQKCNFEHIGTEVIKDSDLAGLPTIEVNGFLGDDNEEVIYVPFCHPDENKYDCSVCEIFMRREGE